MRKSHGKQSLSLVSRILFPAPAPSYSVDSFPRELIWVPKRLDDPSRCPPSECIPCLLLPYPSARFVIIFFHSNAEDLGKCHTFCSFLREQFQVHVLAVEYPGYGICPGEASSESIMENAWAAFQFVTDVLRWPLDGIKLFGRSIGTGPAAGLAAKLHVAGVILVTPFLSIRDLFREKVGPLGVLVEERFCNKDCVAKITSPTMIIHGKRDALIPCHHGEQLYELCKSRKLLVSPADMEHNTNLLANLGFFVLPMFQFFSLPDYSFEEMTVPLWVYDKRCSTFYTRPCPEVESGQWPKENTSPGILRPSGDEGGGPEVEARRFHGRVAMSNGDQAPTDSEQFAIETQPTVRHRSTAATKGRYAFDSEVNQGEGSPVADVDAREFDEASEVLQVLPRSTPQVLSNRAKMCGKSTPLNCTGPLQCCSGVENGKLNGI